jgi:hypothetical protein
MNLLIYFFLRFSLNYGKFIEKLVKGHLESAEIESDKQAAPFSPNASHL